MTRRDLRVFLLVFPLVASFVGGCGSSDSASSKDWIGKTFLIDTPNLPPGYWVQPKGFGADIGAYVPQFLIGVEAGTGSDLNIALATTLGSPNPNAQDTCVATTQVTASGAGYPGIDIKAASFPMRIYDVEKNTYVAGIAHNLELTNVLPGNQDPASASLVATVDVQDLYSLFHLIPNATPDNVCSTFQSQNVPCEVCPHNGQAYCLTLKAVQVSAIPASTPIQKVTSPNCP
jgi:hypothetical protein